MWIKILKRSFREGSIQLWRNKFLSATTIFLGGLILFLLNFVFAIKYFAETSIANLESRADFKIALQSTAQPFDIESLINELNNKYDLDIVVDEAQQQKDFLIPARLHIKFKKLSEVSAIFESIQKLRYGDVIGDWDTEAEKDFVNIVERLLRIRNGVENATFWLLILFLMGGIFLTINTFKIVLFSRKDEVFIARLVGADARFIVGPFLMEGFLLGISAAILAIFATILVLREIKTFPGGDIFYFLWNHVFQLEICIAGLIGALGAWIAIKGYLNGKING